MNGRNPGVVYGNTLDKFRKAERDLQRAFRRWEKFRQALNRAEKRLDLAFRVESEREEKS